eukprot:9476556-Pyramimonas_sp.AAC.1
MDHVRVFSGDRRTKSTGLSSICALRPSGSFEDEDEVQYHTFSSMMNELKFSDGFYSSLSM